MHKQCVFCNSKMVQQEYISIGDNKALDNNMFKLLGGKRTDNINFMEVILCICEKCGYVAFFKRDVYEKQ